MSWDNFFKPLTTWNGCDSKNRSELRTGMENIGGQDQIRTKVLGDGGLLRTRGGHPEVLYRNEEKLPDPLPVLTMHGKIIDGTLYLYDDNTNTPTGKTFALKYAPNGWGGNATYIHGHTQYIKGLSLDQGSATVPLAVANALPKDDSLLFGYHQWHTVKEASPEFNYSGQNKWVYQAPSGDKHVMKVTFTVPSMGVSAGYWRGVGQFWTVTASLIAQKIKVDGTLESPVTVFSGVTFTVSNVTAYPLEWDNYLRYGDNQPFEGVNVSPRGDEAIINWLVNIDYGYSIGNDGTRNFCAKTMRLTITESSGVLSGSLAVDLDESACYVLTPFQDNSTSTPAPDYALSLSVSGTVFTYSWAPSGNYYESNAVEDKTESKLFLIVRGFDPAATSNTVTGLWYKYEINQQSTYTATQTSSGSLSFDTSADPVVMSGTASQTLSWTNNSLRYIAHSLLKDGVVAAEYRSETRQNGTGSDTLVQDSSGSNYTRIAPAIYTEQLSICNGVRSVEKGTLQGAISESSTSGFPTQPESFYGNFRHVEFDSVWLETNNCACVKITGYNFVADVPSGPLDPMADVYQKIVSAALGSHAGDPAAYSFPWRLYIGRNYTDGSYRVFKDAVSWNPRRRMLWGIVETESRPYDPSYTSEPHRVTWI